MADLKTETAEYHLDAPLVEVALDLQIRFVQLSGGAINYVPGLIQAVVQGRKEEAGFEAMMAFAKVFRDNESRDIKGFINDVITLVEIKRPAGFSKCNVNGDFTGKIKELYKVLFWATGEILSDFFSELLEDTTQKPPRMT